MTDVVFIMQNPLVKDIEPGFLCYNRLHVTTASATIFLYTE